MTWTLNTEKTMSLNGRCMVDTMTWFQAIGEQPETLKVGTYKTRDNADISSISLEDWQSVLVFERPDKDWYVLLKRTSPTRRFSRHHTQTKYLARIDTVDLPSTDDTFVFHVLEYCTVLSNLRSLVGSMDPELSPEGRKGLRRRIIEHVLEFMNREGQCVSEKCARDLIECVNREDALSMFPDLDAESRSNLATCYVEKDNIDVEMVRVLFPDFECAPVFHTKSSDWAGLKKLHELGYTLTESFPIRYSMWDDKMGHPVTDNGCFLFTYRKVLLGLGRLRPFCYLNLDALDSVLSIVAEFARCS